ncbi:hypothetical protein Trydic_g10258 [Trypoxylus dichotomus]
MNKGRPRNSTSSVSSDYTTENSWLEDDVLRRGDVETLSRKEEEFWYGLLDKYLYPIDDSKDKLRVIQSLKDLRDKVVLSFFIINTLFVLIVTILSMNQDIIYIKWPLGYSVNFTYMNDINLVQIEKTYLQLEPTGMTFLVVFALLIFIQFIGMFVHRFKTFTQILANTVINLPFWKTKAVQANEDETFEKNLVEAIKQLQKLKGVVDNKKRSQIQPARRRTAVWLDQRSQMAPETINDLHSVFQRRVENATDNEDSIGPLRRDTIVTMQKRKSRAARSSGLVELIPLEDIRTESQDLGNSVP